MYKGASQKQQFLERSGSFSTHGGATSGGLLGDGVKEEMTPTQKREALLKRRDQLDDMLRGINERKVGLHPVRQQNQLAALNKERIPIASEMAAICAQLREVNAALGKVSSSLKQDIGEFIIIVCRERHTKPQWQAIMREAQERFDAYKQSQKE
jgi:hypothetical protein